MLVLVACAGLVSVKASLRNGAVSSPVIRLDQVTITVLLLANSCRAYSLELCHYTKYGNDGYIKLLLVTAETNYNVLCHQMSVLMYCKLATFCVSLT